MWLRWEGWDLVISARRHMHRAFVIATEELSPWTRFGGCSFAIRGIVAGDNA